MKKHPILSSQNLLILSCIILIALITLEMKLKAALPSAHEPQDKIEPVKIAHRIYTLKNKKEMLARFCENGARLMSLVVSGKNNRLIDVVIGFEDAFDYDTEFKAFRNLLV